MTDTVKLWLISAGVRAIKTMAQAAIGVIGASAAMSDVQCMSDVQWGVVASAAILAGIASLITSIAGLPEVSDGDSLPKIQQSQSR